MKNIKRDLIILALIVISSLSGCLSSQLPVTTSTETSRELLSDEYLSMNIDNVYKFLNDDNLVDAEKNLSVFRAIKLPVEIEKLYFLAEGILAFHNERYIQAEDFFNRALPLTEAIVGLIGCKLNIRNASDLTFIEETFKEIPEGFSSNIYKKFSANYIDILYAYHLYWTGDGFSYQEIVQQVEIKNLVNSNVLIDRILKQLSDDLDTMNDNIVEE